MTVYLATTDAANELLPRDPLVLLIGMLLHRHGVSRTEDEASRLFHGREQ